MVVGKDGWGARSALGGTLRALEDLEGNRDGLWGNESKPAGTVGDTFSRQPLLLKISSALKVGVSRQDEIARLTRFRKEAEAAWGEPTLNPSIESKLKAGQLYGAQKAVTLARLGRRPSEVTESFVAAAGSVEGKAIAPRSLFQQHWAPVGKPSGQVVVVSPGFQETWRSFVDQIDALNRAGHDVVVMDHQWAGDSEGSPGGIDRGYGVTRDVAAVTAHAAQLAASKYGASGSVVLYGNSMGAGPGVFAALLLNDNDRIALDGPAMPKGLSAVVQSPFFGPTRSAGNRLLNAAAKLPFVNRIQSPAMGIPDLTDDPVAEQKGAQSAALGDVRAQLKAMAAAANDLERIRERVGQGERPAGRIIFIHGDKDPLADPGWTSQMASYLRAELRMVDSANHVFQESPTESRLALDALEALRTQS